LLKIKLEYKWKHACQFFRLSEFRGNRDMELSLDKILWIEKVLFNEFADIFYKNSRHINLQLRKIQTIELLLHGDILNEFKLKVCY